MKLLKLALYFALSATMFSCADETEDPDAPKPTLTVTELGTGMTDQDIAVSPGTTLMFKWNALKTGGGKNLKTFELFQSGTNVVSPIPTTSNGQDLPITNLPNKYESQYVDTLTLNAGANIGITTYTFVVTDSEGKSASQIINVSVENPTTPLSTLEKGKFYHIGGTLPGAYNLVGDTTVLVGGAAANKDMVNTNAVGDPFTGGFTNSNNTMFVKNNSFDFSNATEEAAIAAYNAGTASATVNAPAVGDIYIAKLRGANDYTVIKILTIDPTNNDCSCGNKGIMTFEYRKK